MSVAIPQVNGLCRYLQTSGKVYNNVRLINVSVEIYGCGEMDEKVYNERFRRDIPEVRGREESKGSSVNPRDSEASDSGVLPEAAISLEYVAGFFDGEGTVSLKRQLLLGFSNSDKRVLREIQKFLGMGSLSRNKRAKNKVVYQLRIYHRKQCIKVAKMLLPKCIVKREELEKFIEYIETKNWFNRGSKAIAKEVLEELYLNQKMSIREIANKFNYSCHKVSYDMRLRGIPIRSISEGNKLTAGKRKNARKALSQNEIWFLYHIKKWSIRKCAEHFGCSYTAIRTRLGNSVRSRHEANLISWARRRGELK